MGEARRRGTFEERKRLAVARVAQKTARMASQRPSSQMGAIGGPEICTERRHTGKDRAARAALRHRARMLLAAGALGTLFSMR